MKTLKEKLEFYRAGRPDEWTMDEFIRDAKMMQKENDELKSKLDELSMAANEVCIYLNEDKYNNIGSKSALHTQLEFVLNQTPQQSLNEIKAQAIEDAINVCPFYSMETTMESSTITVRINDLKECANKLRGEK